MTNLFGFLRSPQWILGRRIALVAIILVVAYRNYGGSILAFFQGASGARDVVLTRYEFRPELGTGKPIWVLGLRNTSSRHTYDRIELKAIYKDAGGAVLQSDTLTVRQLLKPGDEELIASPDRKERPNATTGTLEVTGAASVDK